MRETRDKVEKHRRLTDDLILKGTVRMNSYAHDRQVKESDSLRKSLELIGMANHYLYLASLVLE